MNYALVLNAHTIDNTKISFHGVIEASKTDVLEAIDILKENAIQIVDPFTLEEQFRNVKETRIDFILQAQAES